MNLWASREKGDRCIQVWDTLSLRRRDEQGIALDADRTREQLIRLGVAIPPSLTQ
ncbi:hypothetical protein HC928_13970 [bacterium]|nr:hypothetical protein [bacterium]